MKQIYCIRHEKKKKKKFWNYNKTLVFSSISYECGSNNDKIFRKEQYMKIIKILGLINNING